MSDQNRGDMLFELIQNVSNQVLELAKGQSGLDSCIKSIKRQFENIESRMDLISVDQARIKEILQNKMSPDRCSFMHDDVKRQIASEIADAIKPTCIHNHEKLKREIFKEMKEGARGWMRTSIMVAKFVAYLGAAFGGGALGYTQIASMLGGG